MYFISPAASPALDVAEDQSGSYSYGNHMDYRSYILAQRNHTHIGAGLVAQLLALINDAAHQSNQDTLCLIGFYQINAFLCCGAAPRITATPGISPVTRGTPSSRITASARWP